VDYVGIPGISVPVSRIVAGTDQLVSRPQWFVRGRRIASPFVSQRRQQEHFELLDGLLAAGCTAFDTARAYGDSERTLGAWLRARRVRDRVVVISKGGHPGPGWRPRLSAGEISRDLERSLEALQTDYIDLYLLHYVENTREVGPLVDVLNRFVAAGRIRAIGVSNWSTARIDSAIRHAGATSQRAFVASSVQFSLATWQTPPWRSAVTLSGDDAETDRQWYRAHDLWLLAYSSLAMGFFSPSRPYAEDERGVPKAKRFGDRVFLHVDNLARLKRARELAQRRGVTPGQVALAWVLRYHPRVVAIVGARTVASYSDAVGACDVTLSEAERQWLAHGT
jgi:aryl-alcohol dehydrogenase-like predicted oxidoreductase